MGGGCAYKSMTISAILMNVFGAIYSIYSIFTGETEWYIGAIACAIFLGLAYFAYRNFAKVIAGIFFIAACYKIYNTTRGRGGLLTAIVCLGIAIAAYIYGRYIQQERESSDYGSNSTGTADTQAKDVGTDKSTAEYWSEEANRAFRLGRVEEAIEYVNKALEIDPENSVNWNNRAFFLSRAERHEEAIECYNRALEIDPNAKSALFNKSISEEALERWDDAVYTLRRFLEIASPENPDDRNEILNARERLEEFEKRV